MAQYTPILQAGYPSPTRNLRARQQRGQQANAAIFWGTVSLIALAGTGLMLHSHQPSIAEQPLEPAIAATLPTEDALEATAAAATAVQPAADSRAIAARPDPKLLLLASHPVAPAAAPTSAPRHNLTLKPIADPAPRPATSSSPRHPSSPAAVEAPQQRIARLQTQLRGSAEAQRAREYLQTLRDSDVRMSQR